MNSADSNETIVAVYDTEAEADAAVRDLKAAGVPSGAISEHSQRGAADEDVTADANPLHWHFWARQLGFEPTQEQEHEAAVYHHSIAAGSTVVSVDSAAATGVDVAAILEQHNPVDIEARAASYERTSTDDTLTQGGGRRVINRGTPTVRRYVADNPDE